MKCHDLRAIFREQFLLSNLERFTKRGDVGLIKVKKQVDFKIYFM